MVNLFKEATIHEKKLIEALSKYDIIVTYSPGINEVVGKQYRFKNDARKPDFLMMDAHTGKIAYLELKDKGIPVYFGIANDYRHGFDVNVFQDYYRTMKLTGIPIYIIFEEKDSIPNYVGRYGSRQGEPIDIGGYWIAQLDDPRIHKEVESAKNPKPKVYWSRNTLIPIADIRRTLKW